MGKPDTPGLPISRAPISHRLPSPFAPQPLSKMVTVTRVGSNYRLSAHFILTENRTGESGSEGLGLFHSRLSPPPVRPITNSLNISLFRVLATAEQARTPSVAVTLPCFFGGDWLAFNSSLSCPLKLVGLWSLFPLLPCHVRFVLIDS